MTGKKMFFTLVLLAAVGGMVLVYGDQGWVRMKDMKRQSRALVEANNQLREENRLLVDHITRIKSDPRVIEDEARKKLGLIRPDETIYRLNQEPDITVSEPN